jgi:leucyl aminopeptidase
MLKLKVEYGVSAKQKPLVGVFVTGDGNRNFDSLLKKYDISPNVVRDSGFSGKKDEIFESYIPQVGGLVGFIFLGLGKETVSDNARRAGGNLAGIIAKKNLSGVRILQLSLPGENIGPFIEGMILGGYTFDRFKTEKSPERLVRVVFDESSEGSKDKVERAMAIAEASCFARDLVNAPGNYLYPVELANQAKSLARKYGIACKVFGPKEITGMKMGAMMGVAKGSEQPPQFIHWTYNGGRPGEKPIVLVGKGVTFDSGGISIKPSEGMQEMKNDMTGAAVVTAIMMVLGRTRPKINVVGIAPCVENLPSGKAYRPGDILTACDGQTIEVISTDAEGRLILADALCYAEKLKPKVIIDIATLTGAVIVGLGNHAAGILGTDDHVLDLLYKAGQKTGEKTWQLPLWDEYKEQIKSDVADMKNSGGRAGGTITAACFLAKFVKETPWAHIDIAGMDNQDKGHPYQPKGGTGFGVRLFAEYILNQAK